MWDGSILQKPLSIVVIRPGYLARITRGVCVFWTVGDAPQVKSKIAVFI